MRYSVLKIRSLIESGLTWRQVCERMGCCEETVRRALLSGDKYDAFLAAGNRRKKKYRAGLRNGVKAAQYSNWGRNN